MTTSAGSSRPERSAGDAGPDTQAPLPRPVDEVERLRLYLVETRAWCRFCNGELDAACSPRCPGCGRTLTTRDVSAGRRTWASRVGERLGRAIHRRYHPQRPSRRIADLRPARDGNSPNAGPPSAAPLTDDERIRLFLLDNDAECPGCGYDLFGLESATCPECGRSLTITALKRGRMRWLTVSFAVGLLALILAMAASLALPVKGVLLMTPEYRHTPLVLFMVGFMLLPVCVLTWLAGKWVNYAVVVARLPLLERWGLALACWAVLALVAFAAWRM